MNCYIVSYDLKNASIVEYENIIKEIKSYKTWAKILESMRAIKTTKKASEIRDHLKKHMKIGSRLFVIRSGVESAWTNIICSSERLKGNL